MKKLELKSVDEKSIRKFMEELYEFKRLNKSGLYEFPGDNTFFGEHNTDKFIVKGSKVVVNQCVRFFRFKVTISEVVGYLEKNIANKLSVTTSNEFTGDGEVSWIDIQLTLRV